MLSLSLIAQSTPDISGVPADFVKSFLIMFAFMAAIGGGVAIGRRGSKASPLHLEQPVAVDANVSHAPVYAHQAALEKLRADMEARTRENLRQLEEHSSRLSEIINAGHERQQTILKALSEMESRMTTATLRELKDIHDRLNPMGENVAAHGQAIKDLTGRLQHLWEMIQTLWSHVFRKAAPRT